MESNFELDQAQWSRLRALLDQAMARRADERERYLAALSGDDATLQPRLRALLAHADETALPLDTLPRIETAQFAGTAPRGDDEPGAGTRIGPYLLTRLLGEGGMGSVWLAERHDMLQRRAVALKLPRLTGSRAHLAERLAREREILAALDHPNIARLLDAGLHEGRPFIALEYVEGERIDRWCAARELDLPARLRLFLQVADAVAHAHARLVVHRDLKPANVLVTAAGEVKLLDFGIAKLLEDDGRAAETELTQQAGRALTPEYAAPEQILGQPIGTAADVYALGVLLFELLTGARPYRLRRESRAALEDAIAQAEVRRPSEVASDRRLRQRLRGDLDAIVLKALQRDPARRYAAVPSFAEDIERHLERRPVGARPDALGYRLRRFLARNRFAVGAVAAVLLTALAGAAAALWQARTAAQERDIALREKRNAEEVRNFALAMFRDAGPQNAAGRVLSMTEVLRRARERIATIDPARAEVRLELLTTVADSLLMLDDAGGAQEVLTQAIADGGSRLGAGHDLVLRAKSMLSQSFRRQSRYAEMRAVLDEIVPLLREREQRLPNLLLSALVNRSNLDGDLGLFAQADASTTEGLALIERRFSGRHANAPLLRVRRSHFLALQGDAGGALAQAERALALGLELNQGNRAHAMVLFARAGRADALLAAGRVDEASAEREGVLADSEAAFAGRTRIWAQRVLAGLPIDMEVRPAADVATRSAEALALLGGYQGSERDELTMARAAAVHGAAMLAAGRTADAAPLLAQAAQALRDALSPEHPFVLSTTQALAHALAASGDRGRAAQLLADSPSPAALPYPAFALRAWADRAAALALMGRVDEAAAAREAARAQAARLAHVPRDIRRLLDTTLAGR